MPGRFTSITHEVGQQPACHRHGLLTRGGAADDLETRGLLHQGAHRAQYRGLVVDQHDPHHRHDSLTSETSLMADG